MQRRLEFRLIGTNGKVCGFEKWYPGEFHKNGQWAAQPCWLYSKDGDYWNPEPIFHRKKNQFCGLSDKNGKECYEGDIIDHNGEVFEVVWGAEGAWIAKGISSRLDPHTGDDYQVSDDLLSERIKVAEIVGNVYEG